MKRLDALVLRELIGPWAFGVAMFTMLLVAGLYLQRMAQYLVDGVATGTILHIIVLLLPGVLVQTFAMSLLLGALLAFGRLSGDSEITAIRASGVSLYRIVAPVACFSLLVAGVSFYMNEHLAPKAFRESSTIMMDIARKGQFHAAQPISVPYVKDGRLVAMIGAVNFNVQDSTLQGVHIVAYDNEEKRVQVKKPDGSVGWVGTGEFDSPHETYILFADELYFAGDLKSGDLRSWRIRGQARILKADGSELIKLNGAWPTQIPTLTTSPADLLAGQNSDPSTFSMQEIQDRIKKGKESGNLTIFQIRNYEYQYWNKIALPLAAFIFGILGATLGIRNHRTGTATGFAIAIAIIFTYFTLASFMNVFARGGIFPSYVASFTPIVIGLIASGVIIWRRNR
jgi:lipopolysaccharide export system permease protein